MEQKAKMNFNDEQKKAIESEKPLVLISAGAGSGKTRVLTERFLYLCNKKLAEIIDEEKPTIGAEVKEIVAITFTEKAAREMKKRIRERVSEELNEVSAWDDDSRKEKAIVFWKEQRDSLDSSFITTFHSFCHKILHHFAFKANLSPNFSVLDETQGTLIKNQVFNELFGKESNHDKWKPLYTYYTKKQLKDSVLKVYDQIQENPNYDVKGYIGQSNAKEAISLQLGVINKAKKEILESFYIAARECVLQFPHVNDVKGKLKEHLPNVENHVSSINLDEIEPDECYKLINSVMPRTHPSWANTAPSLYELCKDHYSFLKDKWKRYQTFPKDKMDIFCLIIELFLDILCQFSSAYQMKKDEKAALDFGDLQKKAISLLKNNEEIQAWCRNEYKHFMVDEFQDTNGLQMGMLDFIKPQNRFIVGDGKQSIYRFRGADVTLMNNLEGQMVGDENADFIDMGKNERNCDSIIQFVNELFKCLLIKNDDTLGFGINYNPLVSNRCDEFESFPHKKVELLILEKEDGEPESELAAESEDELTSEFDTEFDMLTERMLEIVNEGREIAKGKVLVDGELKETWRKPMWRDFAILMPSRTGLGDLEKKLKDKNIPYIVHGGIGFYQKHEVGDMLNLLKFINRPWEPIYILALLRGPLFQLTMNDFFIINSRLDRETGTLSNYVLNKEFDSDKNLPQVLKGKLKKFYQLYLRFVPFLPQRSFKDTLLDIFEGSGLKTALLLQPNPLQLVKNVEKLIDIMANQNSHSLEELLEQVDILASLSDKEGEADAEIPEGNMVNIMTVHASKGLEFPIVCLPKLNRMLQLDSGNFIYDEESWLVSTFKEDDEEDPLKDPKKYFTPCYGMVKSKADVAALEESKRLFYVATTRARDYLVMTAMVKVNTQEEKDKTIEKSWLAMVNESLEYNPNLQQFMEVKTHNDLTRQGTAQREEEVFEAKTISESVEIPYTFSVSEIMAFMNDPVKYYDNYILKLNPQWFIEKGENDFFQSENTIGGTELGTLVHRACELFDQGFSEEEAAQEALGDFAEETVDLTAVQKQILQLLDKYKEIQGLDFGEHIDSEWSFVTEIEGAHVIGEIDKVLRKNDAIHLMDLKTNRIKNLKAQFESYMPQMYLYKMAFENEEKMVVDEVSLFFMKAGKEGLLTTKIDTGYEDKVKTAIRKMTELKRQGASRIQYSELNEEQLS